MQMEIATTAYTNHPMRLEAFKHALKGLRQHIFPKDRTITRHLVSSEQLSPEDAERFEELCKIYGADWQYHPAPADIGRNLNYLDAALTGPYVLHTECDSGIQTDLDLSPDVAFLEANPDFLYVRYCSPFTRPLQNLRPDLVELDKAASPFSNLGYLLHLYRFRDAFPQGHLIDAGHGIQESTMGLWVRASKWRIAARTENFFGHGGGVSAHRKG